MSGAKFKVVHYINQFFGQIGGEDKADVGFSKKEGPVGPGMMIESLFDGQADVVATVICGDNYFSRDVEGNARKFIEMIKDYEPDLVIAGPAFEAGRYGVSCGAVCNAVTEELKIPAITGMYPENPGVDLSRGNAFIIKTGNSARNMSKDLSKMIRLALDILERRSADSFLTGDGVGSPEEYEYFPRGIIQNVLSDRTAAERAVGILLKKIRREEYKSELTLPRFDDIPSPAPILDPAKCAIAVVSDGGLCSKGNDAGLSGRGNAVWTTYPIEDFFSEDKGKEDYEVVHTGYFSVDVLDDVNRLVPIDVLKELVNEGKIGSIYPFYLCTSGNATVAKKCQVMGEGMARKLSEDGVDAVILTST